ncbi:MAG TPA: MXAN_6640 family putative metalloprotease [Candidatus Eisenbacteria bacterium]|jgi:hypothetical protein
MATFGLFQPARHPAWLLIGCLFVFTGMSGPVSASAVEVQEPRLHAPLERLEVAWSRGEITYSEAARQKLYYLFDRAQMDRAWSRGDMRPARCGTLVLAEIGSHLDRLDAETRALYDRYTAAPSQVLAPTQVYQTTHFYIEYTTSGAGGVPPDDLNPANGVPDFVEWTGTACEYSWSTEVDNLGYLAPQLTGGPNNKYSISYQNQQSYGFTTVVSGLRTKIVLHPNFIGFPPNDDPEGNQIGALRVTVAHEFKHAIQRMYSSWSEGGWVELDATWMEDIAYDNVNDYYNYVRGTGSPFTEPQTALDAGGTGSYEDCNWQHYQSEKLGNAHMHGFWVRRQAFPGEPVLTTYAQNLAASGLSFEDAWGEYVAWNFACGSRIGSGYGYGEANRYWAPPATSTHASLPVPTTAGSVDHLAANERVVTNYDRTLTGTPEFTFAGSPTVSWRVSVVLRDFQGNLARVPVPLSGGAGTLLLSAYDWSNLDWAGLVIGNPSTSGSAASYTFSARAVAPVFITHQRLWSTTNTSTPYAVTTLVTAGSGTPDPSTVELTYRVDGGAPLTLPMSATGNPNEYTANIPAQSIGRIVEYRISSRSTLNELVSLPAGGGYHSFNIDTAFEPFETAGGWTVGDVGDNATTGLWQRVVPLGTVAQPDADFTGAPGASCFVTANGTPGGAAGEADVDGGKTTLLSPVFNLSAGGPYSRVVARYRRWYSNHLGSEVDDTWRVDASNNGGSSWTNVETVTLGNNTWTPVSVDLLALFGAPNQIRLRFVAEDAGDGSVVEAGVDDFELVAVPQGSVGVPFPAVAGIRLGPPVPNPVRGQTSLALGLPAAASVSAVLRDLQGRTVRRLIPEGSRLEAGPSVIRWDGRGEGGAELPTGVYFLQVMVAGQAFERRLVLLK